MKTRFYGSIKTEIPESRILSRLGYASGITKIRDEEAILIKKYVSEAVEEIELKGAVLRARIEKNNDNSVALSEGKALYGVSISKFLSDTDEVLFVGATAGKCVLEAISEMSKNDNISKAVVYDAVASEMADAALDWLGKIQSTELIREGRCLTNKRFSAGYGDFDLKNQLLIFDILRLKELGVSINDDFILSPEKTVTGIYGILPVSNEISETEKR